jgi:hypothetical protein
LIDNGAAQRATRAVTCARQLHVNPPARAPCSTAHDSLPPARLCSCAREQPRRLERDAPRLWQRAARFADAAAATTASACGRA